MKLYFSFLYICSLIMKPLQKKAKSQALTDNDDNLPSDNFINCQIINLLPFKNVPSSFFQTTTFDVNVAAHRR